MIQERTIEIMTAARIVGIDDNDRYIGIVNGQFEKRFQQIFQSLLRDDAIVFDIGANIGVISVILSTLRRGAKIFAIEPGPRVFRVLGDNLKRNHASNVTAVQCAVTNVEGSIEFVEDSAYGHAVASPEGGSAGRTVHVSSTTIDSLSRTYAPDRLDFIKLDIEGFEAQALEGASWTIARLNPVMLMELNPWCISNYGRRDPHELVRSIYRDFRYVYLVNKSDWTVESPVLRSSAEEIIALMKQDDLYCNDLLFSNNPRLDAAMSKWF